MRRATRRALCALAGGAWAVAAGAGARADDAELFLGTWSPRVRPNVLLVVDDSGPADGATAAERAAAAARLRALEDAALVLIDALGDANVGLMSFAGGGGSVDVAVADGEAGRETLRAAVAGLSAEQPYAPAAALYEAALYWLGAPVDYGAWGDAAARRPGEPARYASPIELSCQRNHVVLLMGNEGGDGAADAKILALTDAAGDPFARLVEGGACDAEPDAGGSVCLDDLAEFLRRADLSPLPGRQSVITHVVSAGPEQPLLARTAARGGGEHRTADDAAALAAVLSGVAAQILAAPSSAVPPAVTVDAFNRTQHGNDLYVAVFEPSATVHWPGNVKKYRLSPTGIVDADGVPAVDPATGFFAPGARSFWSSWPDGHDVAAGGAAQRIPLPRKVLTWLGDRDLTAPGNRVDAANGALTGALLGVHAGGPTREEIIDFMSDAVDRDGDGVPDRRHAMGDSLHSPPVALPYGPDGGGVTVYAATNDGYLHAIDGDSGVERWAFVPPELLPRQAALLEDNPSAKSYGLDGPLHLHVVDDGDGAIEPENGEKAYLYFGMRRGGRAYYALDVTRRDAPALLWRHDDETLPRLEQTWAAPVPARIDIAGAPYASDNTDRLVVVMTGGYDPDQDQPEASVDDTGNALYIVDAVSGDLLWWASDADATQRFAAANGAMRYSMPGGVKVLDMDADGFADRLYAADMGGQVWRFDLWNGHDAASLATGGVIASLGAAAAAKPTAAETRRFYYAPDVALAASAGGSAYLHVALGSGHRARPNAIANDDRFYAIRDRFPFRRRTQEEYDRAVPVTDADLVDVTDRPAPVVPAGVPGWRYALRAPGEKVLAESRTFDGRVFFTTYTPGTPSEADPCKPALGTSRLYALSVADGAPALPAVAASDAPFVELAAPVAPAPLFLFPPADPAPCAGAGCTVPPSGCAGEACAPEPLVCVGLACLPTGYRNRPLRTYWVREDVE
ncbi:MAG TPA: PilC/PilY family type IV pilus protein [Gammaproteobacteria bacterium]